ncbi:MULTISPECIES: hypothetical protein [Hydrotalea]|uniref:hypothetical protein n=1 Tax=Hydrotalea TaxID=1004300 RepID=UPI001C449A58|nr:MULTISPECIES: hypothetical protein [Hydrotalea]
MQQLKIFTFFVFISFLCLSRTFAQSSSDSTHSYWKASVDYLSNAVYNGRKDSAVLPYITPIIGYYHKSGLYFSASVAYAAVANENRIDYFSLDAGYNFSIQNFSGDVRANKAFYNAQSTAIKSDIKGGIGADLSYDFNFLQAGISADVIFDNKTDIAFNTNIAHAFSWGTENRQWSITPTLAANFSSLYFYEGYTNRRVGKAIKKINPNVVSVKSTTLVPNPGITLLDYEASLPLMYDAKKWGIAFTPTYAIPMNKIETTTTTTYTLKNRTTYTITNNTTPASEKHLANSFFAELTIYFKF